MKKYLQRSWALLITIVLTIAGLFPLINASVAHAISYGLVTSRSVEMSDSSNGHTATTYTVGFTTATTGVIQGLVVDFCSNDPIIGDTCTAPAGFTVGTPTVTPSPPTGLAGSWTASSLNSGRTLTLVNASGASVPASTAVSFNITTVTNPTTTNTTFYARILTYTTSGGATGYTDTSPGSVVDAGGIALSTAALINVTAKVQEQITFCVYTGANCGAGGTTVTLGDTNGVLSSAGPFVDKNTRYDIATNAGSGVVIRLKGPTLTFGVNTITAIGSSAAASASGTSQFGLCNYQSTGANLTPAAPYNNANCSTTTQTAGTGSTGGNGTAQFAFNVANTTSTYGDIIANATAGPSSTGTIPFIGNITTSQAAGVYTTTLTFIATGTY